VVAQGTLGGLTVLFLLPLPVSVAHACLGQLFFTLTVVLAVVTSRSWLAGAPAEPHADAPALHGWTLVTALAVFVQLVLGALVRHFPDASLAIPTFPLAFGRLVPPDLTPPVAVQFAHRVFALVVFSLAVATTVRVCRRHGDRAALVLPSLALGLLVLFQGMLGGAVVLTGAAPWTATAHQTLGAVILAVSVVQAFQARRCCREPVPQAVPA
jgi:cytochrome c oxidase assembly protein subunit 15